MPTWVHHQKSSSFSGRLRHWDVSPEVGNWLREDIDSERLADPP